MATYVSVIISIHALAKHELTYHICHNVTLHVIDTVSYHTLAQFVDIGHHIHIRPHMLAGQLFFMLFLNMS